MRYYWMAFKEDFYLGLKEHSSVEKCIGMTFEEYRKYEIQDKGILAKDAYTELERSLSAEQFVVRLKILYYYDCFNDLTLQKENIKHLWDELLEANAQELTAELEDEIILLLRVSILAKLTQNDLSEILLKVCLGAIKKFPENEVSNLELTLKDITKWYYLRANLEEIVPVRYVEEDILFFKKLYRNNQSQFNIMKTTIPNSFLQFSACVYFLYSRLAIDRRYKYKDFFRQIMLDRISLLKNAGAFEELSESIIIYQREMQKSITEKSKFLVSWMIGFFTGYGEKPFRLLMVLFVLYTFFTILFYPNPFGWGCFEIKGIGEPNQDFFDTIIAILYFNSTTMLTAAYGDMYALNSVTRIAVIIEQILGFLVIGSFISLVLRKMFRY